MNTGLIANHLNKAPKQSDSKNAFSCSNITDEPDEAEHSSAIAGLKVCQYLLTFPAAPKIYDRTFS